MPTFRSSLAVFFAVWKAIFLRRAADRLSTSRAARLWFLPTSVAQVITLLVLFGFIFEGRGGLMNQLNNKACASNASCLVNESAGLGFIFQAAAATLSPLHHFSWLAWVGTADALPALRTK